MVRMDGHDIIVVGASAGGVEALSQLVVQFPKDLVATVFITQHVRATASGYLAQILNRAGPLPATLAQDGESFELAHIYVAPPDYHLLIKHGALQVIRGPQENRVRPAIDPLFRSAAVAYGARVVGVVLTGLQTDGTSGLLAVKRCGGMAIVQDPTDALYPDMPLSAIEHVDVDYCLPVAQMGAVLYQLTQESSPAVVSIPGDLLVEEDMTEHPSHSKLVKELGALVPLICPDCGGPLWELRHKQLVRYRCRLGHVFTAESLLEGQSEVLEQTLWAAVHTMEERTPILTSLASSSRERGHNQLAELYATRAAELQTHVQKLR
jgi:two-component system chemotaxis response regulator CheB